MTSSNSVSHTEQHTKDVAMDVRTSSALTKDGKSTVTAFAPAEEKKKIELFSRVRHAFF